MADKSYKEVVEGKRQEMLNSLLESMENDPGAWQKGWFSFSHIPENGATGKRYRGLNVLFLYGAAKKKGFEDPRWVTYNQAHDLGATIKGGEKASSVFFYREYDKATKRDFDPKTIADLPEDEQLAYREENVRNVLKYSAVFNAEQCENFPKLERKEMSPEEQEKRNRRCETIINHSAAPIHTDGGDSAYYNPATDSIHLPRFNSFKTVQDFYATALHEIAHSTGHESRLNRDLSGAFGSQKYALEELRAELSSVFMQVDLGIDLSGAEVKNHAAYLRSWLTSIQDDPQAFYKAATDADKICKYISTNYLAEEQENTKEEAKLDEVKPITASTTSNNMTYEKVGEDYEIRYSGVAWGLSTSDLPNDVREAAVWLIENGYQSDESVQRAFYDRMTSAMSDDPHAEKNDNEAIKREYQSRRGAASGADARQMAKPQVSYEYQSVLDAQLGAQNAIVAIRMGDFYEIIGDKAEFAAKALDLTLTSRMVGLPERVPMCGFPYHVADQYFEKLSQVSDVVVLEGDKTKREIPKKSETKEEEKSENSGTTEGTEAEVTVAVGSAAVAPITAEAVGAVETPKGTKTVSAWIAAKREKRLSAIEKNVPQEMKDLPQWCAFSTAKDENGGFKKKIWNCNAVGAKTWAKSNDPSTWACFSAALEYARKNGCDGLSFALTPESGIFCVDLDDCKTNGKYTDTAWGVYNAAKQTYCERSVSGEGLHFFGKKAPGVDFSELGNKNADSTFEFYDRSRFMSVTGDVFMKSKSELRVFSDSDRLIPIIKGQLPVKQELKPVTVNHNTASDEDVIVRIRRSKKAAEFDRMFAGENICGDRSRTDLKMMNMLGFFTNGDAEQMKRIFESSGLYRAGEKSRGYIDKTIQKALGSMYGTPDNLNKTAPTATTMKGLPLIGL